MVALQLARDWELWDGYLEHATDNPPRAPIQERLLGSATLHNPISLVAGHPSDESRMQSINQRKV